MKIKYLFLLSWLGFMTLSCVGRESESLIEENFSFAGQQLRHALTEVDKVRDSLGKTRHELPSPRNIEADGS